MPRSARSRARSAGPATGRTTGSRATATSRSTTAAATSPCPSTWPRTRRASARACCARTRSQSCATRWPKPGPIAAARLSCTSRPTATPACPATRAGGTCRSRRWAATRRSGPRAPPTRTRARGRGPICEPARRTVRHGGHARVGRLVVRRLRAAAAERRRGRRARHRRARVLRRRDLRARRRPLRARRLARPGLARHAVRGSARRRLPPAAHALHARRRGGGRSRLRAGGRRRRAARAAGRRDRARDARPRRARAYDQRDPDGRRGGRLAARVRGAHPARALVELPAAQARPRRDARRVPARGDLLLPHRPATGLRPAAGIHRRRQPGRDAVRARPRHRAGAVRLPHGLGAARVRRLLPQRDGRADARLGRRERSRPRMDARAMTAPTATRTLDNYVAGAWTPAAADAETLDVTNPATGELLARVPLSTAADLDAAVQAARAALPEWRAVSVIARARKLFALREGLDARREDLARSVTTEMGKTLVDARAEVARMIEMVEAACAIPTTMQGRVLEDVSRNVDAETVRQPVGVCAGIVPFNFPAMVPFWFLPFAIACGNSFILKPSEQVPLTQQIAFELLDGLGLPDGVVNLVNGGREVVEGILDHPGIDAVSFVGSAPVAKIVYERSAKAGKRVQALGGAKNHMVVMPDAVIDKTVDGIVASGFGAAGQRCMAGSVVVTVGEAHERLLPALKEAAEAVRVGDGLDEQNELGPVVSESARDRIRAAIGKAASEGARVVVDGRDAEGDGSFVGPTILDGVQPGSEAACEEIFGPVLSIISVETLDEAIELINSSRFGNGTSIFTESGASVRRYRHEVEAGMIGVNIGVAAPVAFFPFSGWKDSFLGDLHAHGGDAVEFYTRKKTVTSRWFSSGQGSGAYFVEQ